MAWSSLSGESSPMPSIRSDRVFALVDGNNVYVSCERAFNPRLEGRPVIVLSNNAGCAVARSQEAKDMGIVMGEPWFRLRHLERRGLVHVLVGPRNQSPNAVQRGLEPVFL